MSGKFRDQTRSHTLLDRYEPRQKENCSLQKPCCGCQNRQLLNDALSPHGLEKTSQPLSRKRTAQKPTKGRPRHDSPQKMSSLDSNSQSLLNFHSIRTNPAVKDLLAIYEALGIPLTATPTPQQLIARIISQIESNRIQLQLAEDYLRPLNTQSDFSLAEKVKQFVQVFQGLKQRNSEFVKQIINAEKENMRQARSHHLLENEFEELLKQKLDLQKKITKQCKQLKKHKLAESPTIVYGKQLKDAKSELEAMQAQLFKQINQMKSQMDKFSLQMQQKKTKQLSVCQVFNYIFAGHEAQMLNRPNKLQIVPHVQWQAQSVDLSHLQDCAVQATAATINIFCETIPVQLIEQGTNCEAQTLQQNEPETIEIGIQTFSSLVDVGSQTDKKSHSVAVQSQTESSKSTLELIKTVQFTVYSQVQPPEFSLVVNSKDEIDLFEVNQASETEQYFHGQFQVVMSTKAIQAQCQLQNGQTQTQCQQRQALQNCLIQQYVGKCVKYLDIGSQTDKAAKYEHFDNTETKRLSKIECVASPGLERLKELISLGPSQTSCRQFQAEDHVENLPRVEGLQTSLSLGLEWVQLEGWTLESQIQLLREELSKEHEHSKRLEMQLNDQRVTEDVFDLCI